jgi:hypothetical protein
VSWKKMPSAPPGVGADIAVTVEHDETVAVFERLSWPNGGGCGGNIKWSFHDLPGRD